MAAITGTKVYQGELSGDVRILQLTATVGSASDTITLTEATHGVTEIVGLLGIVITGGLDAGFTNVQASFSGLVITVVSIEQDGTAATDWTGTTVSISLLVR